MDGPFRFSATDMKHSAVARAHWKGAASVGAQIVAGAIGVSQPATGASAAVATQVFSP